jgi:phosphatidylserine/phosphatidylglycerophosphate/cardiolipin synthase-like enzyme
MTVRILLGNPPELALGEFSDQLWNLLSNLRDAGVEEMRNPEIGWKLEVADYKGSAPHSHTKVLIVDGKTTVAAGFNTTYDHFPIAHPSGKGNDRCDLGIQISGPVTQDAQRAFDDLWADSNGRYCLDFHPMLDIAWQTTCRSYKVTSEHVPEVVRYYLPDGPRSNAFSMYRSKAYSLADHQVTSALAAAQESIDTVHVNFTMELLCDLNILYDVCTFGQAPSYLTSLVAAAENGAKIRILIEPAPIEGIESTIAVVLMEKEIKQRGLENQVEVRFFDGNLHMKVSLIDGQFLIVGSQNFHYSAFGDGGGLTEYSLGTDAPQAIEDAQRLFEYHWERAEVFE